jgi:putative phage-type endonuclease
MDEQRKQEMHPRVAALLQRKQYEQRTPEWYEVRDAMLTASDVAAALDIKPFESFKGSARKDLLKKKVLRTKFSNKFTQHGTKLEDVAKTLFEKMSGETVLDFGLLVHPEHAWLGASPDGVTTTGRAIEIKCPVTRKVVPGEVPHHYFPQVQIQMEVMDLDEVVFIQYKPDSLTWPAPGVFDVVVVKRDRDWFDEVLPALREFFDEMIQARLDAVAASPDPAATTPRKTRTTTSDCPAPCLFVPGLYTDEEITASRGSEEGPTEDESPASLVFSFVTDE